MNKISYQVKMTSKSPQLFSWTLITHVSITRMLEVRVAILDQESSFMQEQASSALSGWLAETSLTKSACTTCFAEQVHKRGSSEGLISSKYEHERLTALSFN
jgi:hypothetical protein